MDQRVPVEARPEAEERVCSVSQSTVRGRWRSEATARLYIDIALADSILLSLPRSTLTMFTAVAATLQREVASWGCLECV
eukprot:5003345-Amphidinium_carterae.1